MRANQQAHQKRYQGNSCKSDQNAVNDDQWRHIQVFEEKAQVVDNQLVVGVKNRVYLVDANAQTFINSIGKRQEGNSREQQAKDARGRCPLTAALVGKLLPVVCAIAEKPKQSITA